MSVQRSLMQSGALAAAQAGHEGPYYPSFYPQEIRIEPLDPGAAAREFSNAKDPLHAYLGAIPQFSGEMPSYLKSVVSLRSLITVSVNPQRALGREARCRAIENAANALVTHPDVVPHRYPVTPYHAAATRSRRTMRTTSVTRIATQTRSPSCWLPQTWVPR